MQTQSEAVFPAKSRRPWWPRFRLASLLWLMLCVAIGITAYQAGVENTKRELWHNRSIVGERTTAAYNVADVIEVIPTPQGVLADFDGLIQGIEEEVFPRTWSSAGGNASISGFPTNISLVISHDKEGHEEIARYLEAKRRAAPAVSSP